MVSFFMRHLHQRGHERCQQEQPFVSGLDAVHPVGRHDPDNAVIVGDNCSRKRAASAASEDIMDLHLPGMGMVANGTTGIDPYMMQAQTSPGIFSCHQVPEKDPGKLRMWIPRQRFSGDCLPGYDHRTVPAGRFLFFHDIQSISNFLESM
jgi:hypothetical protein